MTFKLTDLIGPGVAVVAVAVGVWQYRLTSQSEFIRPVREAQLRLYQEASSAAAQIATLPRRIKRMDESQTGIPEAVLSGRSQSSKASIMPPSTMKGSRSKTPW